MEENDAALAGMMAVMGLFFVIIAILQIFIFVCLWKIFEKAGKPGWAALVPVYNIVILLEIIDRPIVWLLYLFIPLANIYFSVLMTVELAKKFGKDTGFGVGLILLPMVFYPMLAFGETHYQGHGEKKYDDGILDRG